jgi:hypothetical protein
LGDAADAAPAELDFSDAAGGGAPAAGAVDALSAGVSLIDVEDDEASEDDEAEAGDEAGSLVIFPCLRANHWILISLSNATRWPGWFENEKDTRGAV